MPIKSRIRTVKHWPKEGVMFRDITTLLKDPVGLQHSISDFIDRYKGKDVDIVAGIDSRGFILGGAVAYELGKGFVPIRKEGKLPAETESVDYELEYGSATLEIHKDAIEEGQNVLVIDDLIATGGTALAAVDLVERLGGKVVEVACIVDLPDLKGSTYLKEKNYAVYAQTSFKGK